MTTQMRPTSEYLWFLKSLPANIINLGGTTPKIPSFVNLWENEIAEPFNVDNNPALNEFKKIISSMTAWPEEEIHLTPGVTEAIFGLLATLTNPGDRVLFSQPYYEPFVSAAQFLGLKIDYFDPRIAHFDKDQLSPYKMILLTNPNCFTGHCCDDFILKLASLITIPIVVDEIYRPFSDEKITFLTSKRPRNIISVGGFSKPTGITNLRIGWVLGSIQNVENLRKFDLFIHTDIPGICIKSALNVMAHWHELVRFHRADFELKRQALAAPLKKWHLDLGTRHFFDIPVPQAFSSDHDFAVALQNKHQMYITEGSYFGAPGRLRISLTGTLSALEQLVKILDTMAL